MSDNKLYVGNISFKVTGDDLQELFSQHGDVAEAIVINDRETGRSRGFGFVTMTDADGVKQALSLDGQEYEGRRMKVNVCEPREPRRGGGGGGGRRGGGGRY